MDCIEEVRRSAFERRECIRAKQKAGSSEWSETTRDLDHALSEDTRLRGTAIGNELILSHQDALAAIGTATEREIAGLGFESGEVQEDEFQAVDCTGSDGNVPFTGDWKAYVEERNIEAERWIKEHRLARIMAIS
jgi:hypothetical protein